MSRNGIRTITILAALVFVVGCGKKAGEVAQEKLLEAAINAGNNKDAKVDIKKDGLSIQTTNEKGEKIDMKMDGNKMTMTTKDGENGVTTITSDKNTVTSTSADGTTVVSGEGAKVPDEFPKDIPVYAGVKVLSASSSPKEATFTLNLQSNDPVKTVAEYYAKEMVAQGWKETQKMEESGDNPMIMLNYEKDNRIAMIHAMNDGGKATIMISTSKNN